MHRQVLAAVAALLVATMAAPAFAADEATPSKRHHRMKRPAFATVDANKDGGITVDELKASLAKHPRMLKRADKMFARMDKDKSGKIEEQEWKGGMGRGRRKRHKDKDAEKGE